MLINIFNAPAKVKTALNYADIYQNIVPCRIVHVHDSVDMI